MVPGLHLILQVEVGNVLALKAGRCHRIQLRLVAISEEATSVAVEFLGLMESQRKAEHCPYVRQGATGKHTACEDPGILQMLRLWDHHQG